VRPQLCRKSARGHAGESLRITRPRGDSVGAGIVTQGGLATDVDARRNPDKVDISGHDSNLARWLTGRHIGSPGIVAVAPYVPAGMAPFPHTVPAPFWRA